MFIWTFFPHNLWYIQKSQPFCLNLLLFSSSFLLLFLFLFFFFLSLLLLLLLLPPPLLLSSCFYSSSLLLLILLLSSSLFFFFTSSFSSSSSSSSSSPLFFSLLLLYLFFLFFSSSSSASSRGWTSFSWKFWPSQRPLFISLDAGYPVSIFNWQMSCLMLSSHLYLGLPCDLLVRGFQLNIFLTVLVSGILCMWPNQLSLWALM